MNAPVDDVVARHLLEARTELLRQRLRIDADLQDINRMLENRGVKARKAGEAGDPQAVVAPATGSRKTTSALTTREAIISVLNSEDREFELSEIVGKVISMGVDAQEGSIRSVMSRVVREGQGAKGSRRSSYRAARSEDAEAGPVTAEPASDVVPELEPEGGDVSSEEGLEGDRDDLDGRNDHHLSGASIKG